jgi:hypothetical protein
MHFADTPNASVRLSQPSIVQRTALRSRKPALFCRSPSEAERVGLRSASLP